MSDDIISSVIRRKPTTEGGAAWLVEVKRADGALHRTTHATKRSAADFLSAFLVFPATDGWLPSLFRSTQKEGVR